MTNLGDKYFHIANNMKGIDSIKYYIKAASEYSLSNQKTNSALSYQLGADSCFNNKLYYQSALNYIKASDQYNDIDNDKSIITLRLAVNLLVITKRFKLAAINFEALGILNIKTERFLEAIDSYEEAYKNYKRSNMNKEALKCLRKMSTIMIENEEYEKAIVHLEKIDTKSKDIFLDIGILRLYINDITICSEFLTKHDKFMLSKEHFLLNDLIIAINENNKMEFCKLFVDYNEIFPFQKWQINLLINVLERI